jgi:hypothetical protein
MVGLSFRLCVAQSRDASGPLPRTRAAVDRSISTLNHPQVKDVKRTSGPNPALKRASPNPRSPRQNKRISRDFSKWRDPDSNRGHHDFRQPDRSALTSEKPLQISSLTRVRQCRRGPCGFVGFLVGYGRGGAATSFSLVTGLALPLRGHARGCGADAMLRRRSVTGISVARATAWHIVSTRVHGRPVACDGTPGPLRAPGLAWRRRPLRRATARRSRVASVSPSTEPRSPPTSTTSKRSSPKRKQPRCQRPNGASSNAACGCCAANRSPAGITSGPRPTRTPARHPGRTPRTPRPRPPHNRRSARPSVGAKTSAGGARARGSLRARSG